MITAAQKELIKATVPVLKEHGITLTQHFYQRMFTHNPELKNMFNMGNQQNNRQQTALAMAVLAYAENIENPAVLMPVVDAIGQKHTSLDIRPEHYIIVGRHLIASIKEVLGAAATEDIVQAWTAAYQQLAQLMWGHEQELYTAQVQKKGGWTGWRPFIVKQKIAASNEITSFYLYPADKGPIADFLPGQFLSVRLFIPELNLLQPRQYSISSAPNQQYYRISVKKETGGEQTPGGMISNRLHQFVKEGDVIDVAAPAGSFTLQDTENPVVFISGGVGQTPLISMLESLVSNNSKAPKVWVHGCRNSGVHAFKEVVDNWTGDQHNVESYFFYNQLDSTPAKDNVFEGWVDISRIRESILLPEASYYICGPAPFIEKHYKDLVEHGVAKDRIYFEEFGPQALRLN